MRPADLGKSGSVTNWSAFARGSNKTSMASPVSLQEGSSQSISGVIHACITDCSDHFAHLHSHFCHLEALNSIYASCGDG